MFGNCKVCAEKDRRIADLKAQIEDLRSISLPKTVSTSIPITALESDAILSGKDEQMLIPDELTDEELAERDRLLSGTY